MYLFKNFLLILTILSSLLSHEMYGKHKCHHAHQSHQEHQQSLSVIDISPDHRESLIEDDGLSSLTDKIKTVDGIDETATIVGQLLPNVAGSIVAGSILTFAVPLVWLGVTGMRNEYQEARDEYLEISRKYESARNQLIAFSKSANRWQNELNKKFGLKLKSIKNSIDSNLSLEEFAVKIVQFQSLKNKEFVHRLGARYGWTGIAGMAGMLGGLMLGVGATAADFAFDMGASAAAVETAAGSLEIAAGSFFMPAQVMMMGYALNRRKQGKRSISILKRTQKNFNKQVNRVSIVTRGQVSQVISKQIEYIKKHSVKYGLRTAIGQSFMFSGTLMGMTGLGLVATGPAFLIGGPLTIGPAIKRIIYTKKESDFKGKVTDYVKKDLNYLDPLSIMILCNNQLSCAYNNLETKLNETTKYLSLLAVVNVLYDHVKIKNPRKKIDKFEKMLNKLQKNSKIKGVDLETRVIEEVKISFKKNIDKFDLILKTDRLSGQKKLLKSLLYILQRKLNDVENIQNTNGDSKLTTEDFKTLYSIGIKKKEIDNYKKSRFGDSELLEITLKNSLLTFKAIRFGIIDSLVSLSQIDQTTQELMVVEKQLFEKG